MAKELEGEWYLVDGEAVFWDGTKYRRFKWKGDPGLYEFQGVWYSWNGTNWKKASVRQINQITSSESVGKSSLNFEPFFNLIKFVAIAALIVFVLNWLWTDATQAPSTRSVCSVFAKATDPRLVYDARSLNASDWWNENIKSIKDLENVDPNVFQALTLYGDTTILRDGGSYLDFELREYVIEECEKSEPGSTKY